MIAGVTEKGAEADVPKVAKMVYVPPGTAGIEKDVENAPMLSEVAE